MQVILEPLERIIQRYTPTLLDVIRPAPAKDVERLESLAGPLPPAYREFLSWMGESCLFLDNIEIAYTPRKLLKVYEDPDDAIPAGFILIGIDDSGNGYDLHIRNSDGLVVRLGEFHDPVTNPDMFIESADCAAFLFRTYVQSALVPSYPLNFAAAFTGDPEQLQELVGRVEEGCRHFEILHPEVCADFRFYGSDDFVMSLHRRPGDSAITLHFGAAERTHYESWYDLVFARWRFQRMPSP